MDSTYIAKGNLASGTVTPLRGVAGTEFATCVNCQMVAFTGGGEIKVFDLAGGELRQITSGGRACHWPEWAPGGRLMSYSRVFSFPNEPDSLSGVRIVDSGSGQDRALMHTAVKPWYARGPATWSQDGSELAFFDAESIVAGQSRLVVVEAGGGSGRTIGWVDGIPGRCSWFVGGVFAFDATPGACPVNETARRTYRIMESTGQIERVGVELGDSGVQFGYPFVLSVDGTQSIHSGSDAAGVGVIAVTDVATGRTRLVTRQ